MKKKIFVKAPILSATGYGEQSRFALRALRSRSDLFDIYVQPITWGQSGWVWETSEERDWIDSRIAETQILLQKKELKPDMSLQITIPNEFEKLCPINIGFTAGIETDRVAPIWLQKGNDMDKILVVSHHAKSTYERTSVTLSDGRVYQLETPVEIVHETTPLAEAQEIPGFTPRHDFNFLVVSQFGPRKNFENTISWFVDNFKDKEVGLIVKTAIKGGSTMDLQATEKRLDAILSHFPNRKCSVSLLHGDLSEGQMRALYEHNKVKCLINLAHGEGFGLPLFEAARLGLPIITIPWSGQLDFLRHDGEDFFKKVAFSIRPVQEHAVWKGVIQPESNWAYADESSYKDALNWMLDNHTEALTTAEKLKGLVETKFRAESLYERFCNAILGKSNLKPVEIDAISFCIPTNGAKPEKTRLTIKSIKRELGDFPHEIIIAGDIESFKDINGVTLVDKSEEAHSRKVATLRNAGGDASKYDTIAWLDDDVIIGKDWLKNTLEFSKITGWNVLGNKLLNPDGTRHWDRATLNPHRMVDYNHPEYDKSLYQTSGFIMVRRDVFKNVRWDDECLVRGDQEGKISEDVKFSLDLIKAGYHLSFNSNSSVWHNDSNYTQLDLNGNPSTLLISKIKELIPNYKEPEFHLRFLKTLEILK
jgi:glycosyltransferase involved in cell wall biosynthesis